MTAPATHSISGRPIALTRATSSVVKRPFLTRSLVWMAALLAAICFEGLGRVVLPQIPSIVLYLSKDVVLLSALLFEGVRRDVLSLARSLLGRWRLFVPLAMGWTLLEIFNPEQVSLALAALGIRSYWVWWIAPLLIASVLRVDRDRNRALVLLAAVAIVVGLYASLQFGSPTDSGINAYALYNGEVVMKTSSVFETGKARVSGTFSYISGFGDFAILASVVLVSLGIDLKARSRIVAVGSGIFIAGCGAMSGSRNVVIYIAVGMLIVFFRAGFFRLRRGRVALLVLLLLSGLAFYHSSEAARGVRSRFELSDTSDRIGRELGVLPPVALMTLPYPLFGIGTGMQQSARVQMGIMTEYFLEDEPPRLLVELGALGYLLFWFARFGLLVGLLRASRILKEGGRMGASGGAMALAVLTMTNRLVFDHVWQALYFTSAGLILSVTMATTRQIAIQRRARKTAATGI